MRTVTINVARDFGDEPYGRYPEHGEFNGERFRQVHLLPALRTADRVIVEMDGAVGYGSSFLEEAFGGLVRLGYFQADALRQKLEVRHRLANNVTRVWKYVDDAAFAAHADRVPEVEKRNAGAP